MQETPRRSFWEKLGRATGHGLQAARQTSAWLGGLGGLKLDLEAARSHLESRYRLLGRLVAEEWIDRGRPDRGAGALPPSHPGVQPLLEEIRACHGRIEELERRLAAQAEPARPAPSIPAPAPVPAAPAVSPQEGSPQDGSPQERL